MREPNRNPVACGALGRFDPELVGGIARALGVDLRDVHADDRSVLRLDREPLRWGEGRTRGLAWSEVTVPPDPKAIRSWEEAATTLDACGLVIAGRSRRVHSSVSGIAPVYWMDHDGATYFASRADALAMALPGLLDVDWEAWSSIFCVRFPVGERTPFEQIRRLRMFSVLERTRAGGVATSLEWPWAQVEAGADLDQAADRTVEALAASLEPLRSTGATILLSGGLDSRMLLGAASDAGVPLRAVTFVPDDGSGIEADVAGEAAAAARVEQERLSARDPEHYLELSEARLVDSDFQFISNPWLMPLVDRVGELGLPVLDGLAIDVLAGRSGRHFDEAALQGGSGTALELWRSLRRDTMAKVPGRAFAEPLARGVVRSSRRQFRNEARAFDGHPSEVILVHYVTRTMRGVATMPAQTMGARARVVVPVAQDRVARAMLALAGAEKVENRMYDAIYGRTRCRAVRLPTMFDGRPEPRRLRPQLRFSAPVVRHYERLLPDGPLAGVLGEPIHEHLAAGTLAEAIRNPSLHRATLAIATFHSWVERYGSKLRDVDPATVFASSDSSPIGDGRVPAE